MQAKLRSYRVTVRPIGDGAPTVTVVLSRWPLMRIMSETLKRRAGTAARIDVDEIGGKEPDGVMWVACDHKGVTA